MFYMNFSINVKYCMFNIIILVFFQSIVLNLRSLNISMLYFLFQALLVSKSL